MTEKAKRVTLKPRDKEEAPVKSKPTKEVKTDANADKS